MKTQKFLMLGIFSLGLLLLPSMAEAKEIAVDSTDLIQDVIDDAGTENGDVLLLADGTYTEEITISKELTLKGSSSDNVIIDGKVTIASNAILDSLTVQGVESEIIDIAGKENITVAINNAVVKFKNYTTDDFGKDNWVSGIRLSKTANGTTLSVTDSKIYAQYAVWVNGEKNSVLIDKSELIGWAALDISNGMSATTQAVDNEVVVTNSSLKGVSYNAVNPSNAYGTVVIGGQSGLNLGFQNSEISNTIVTANAQDLIVFGDAYLTSKDTTIIIDSTKLINNDTNGNSYVYNYGTAENADTTNGNMIVTSTTVEVTAPEGTVDNSITGYVTLTTETFDGAAIIKVPTGLVMDKPEAPEVEGYTFDGWFADADYKTPFDFTKAIDQDTTIYAKFTEIPAPAPEEKNPQTGDNLMIILGMAILSMTGLILGSKKILSRNK